MLSLLFLRAVDESKIGATLQQILNLEAAPVGVTEHYYDIFLHPPNTDDVQHCRDWIRVRNNNGRYSVMFTDQLTEGGFIISPQMSFDVDVKILSGLMALGYQIHAVMTRTSTVFRTPAVTASIDRISQLGGVYAQVKGTDRTLVEMAANALDFGSEYVSQSYINLYLAADGSSAAAGLAPSVVVASGSAASSSSSSSIDAVAATESDHPAAPPLIAAPHLESRL